MDAAKYLTFITNYHATDEEELQLCELGPNKFVERFLISLPISTQVLSCICRITYSLLDARGYARV